MFLHAGPPEYQSGCEATENGVRKAYVVRARQTSYDDCKYEISFGEPSISTIPQGFFMAGLEFCDLVTSDTIYFRPNTYGRDFTDWEDYSGASLWGGDELLTQYLADSLAPNWLVVHTYDDSTRELDASFALTVNAFWPERVPRSYATRYELREGRLRTKIKLVGEE